MEQEGWIQSCRRVKGESWTGLVALARCHAAGEIVQQRYLLHGVQCLFQVQPKTRVITSVSFRPNNSIKGAVTRNMTRWLSGEGFWTHLRQSFHLVDTRL